MPIATVKASHLLAMLRKIEAQGIAYTATRIREHCGQVFRYAVATSRADDNPAAHLLGAIQKPATTHRPAITDRREFGDFLRVVRAADRFTPLTRFGPVLRHVDLRPLAGIPLCALGGNRLAGVRVESTDAPDEERQDLAGV